MTMQQASNRGALPPNLIEPITDRLLHNYVESGAVRARQPSIRVESRGNGQLSRILDDRRFGEQYGRAIPVPTAARRQADVTRAFDRAFEIDSRDVRHPAVVGPDRVPGSQENRPSG